MPVVTLKVTSKDPRMSKQDYDRFYNDILMCNAKLDAKVQPISVEHVRLTDCRIVIDTETMIVKKGERATIDLEKIKQTILDLCNSRGFEIKAAEERTGESV